MTELAGRRLFVRADASTASGTGHLMRALALAQAWLDSGGSATWLVAAAPDALLARIAAEGVPIEWIDAPSGGADDAATLRRALLADPMALGVADGNAFDAEYLGRLEGAAGRVLAIDDLAALSNYPVGLVLNQNAHADRAAYPAGATCRFLLGTSYVLLRREFRPEPAERSIPPHAGRLLVTFGGADPTGMTARAVAALGGLPEPIRRSLQVRVIIGAANPDADRVRSLVAADAALDATVATAVADMAGQMAWADLALTSGGSAIWELARMGCPSLVVETAPSEVLLMSGLARLGLFATLGPQAGLDASRIAAQIALRISDAAWRAEMAALGRRLVDGGGAGRVVDALSGLA